MKSFKKLIKLASPVDSFCLDSPGNDLKTQLINNIMTGVSNIDGISVLNLQSLAELLVTIIAETSL